MDFTLSNARRFYLSKGDPLGMKGLIVLFDSRKRGHFVLVPRVISSRKVGSVCFGCISRYFCLASAVNEFMVVLISEMSVNLGLYMNAFTMREKRTPKSFDSTFSAFPSLLSF